MLCEPIRNTFHTLHRDPPSQSFHVPLFSLLQPVSEWTSLNVVEWMAALNLYRYADVFKSKDIKGSDLLNLDREKLMVSIATRVILSLFFARAARDAFSLVCAAEGDAWRGDRD